MGWGSYVSPSQPMKGSSDRLAPGQVGGWGGGWHPEPVVSQASGNDHPLVGVQVEATMLIGQSVLIRMCSYMMCRKSVLQLQLTLPWCGRQQY